MNNVKNHETNLVSEKNVNDVNDILQSVENVPFALSGATTKTILYALFSCIAAMELTSALGFYTASLGVGMVVAFVMCGFVAAMFHALLHSILSNTAHGIVFRKRAESRAMSAEVVGNIVLSIVLLLGASCTVFFVGKKGFTAYRATEFESKMKDTRSDARPQVAITPDMLTSKNGKLSVYKLELLGKLETAKAATKQAETTANTTEKDSYDKTTNTITDIVGASAFALELLLALLAFTIATAKKAAAMEEIARRKSVAIVTITSENEPKRHKNDIKQVVTTYRNDTQTLDTLPKPSENRTIIKGFERNETVPLRDDTDQKKGTCGNCKTPFTQKNKRHTYCSDACRLEAWQVKNGATIFGTK